MAQGGLRQSLARKEAQLAQLERRQVMLHRRLRQVKAQARPRPRKPIPIGQRPKRPLRFDNLPRRRPLRFDNLKGYSAQPGPRKRHAPQPRKRKGGPYASVGFPPKKVRSLPHSSSRY